MKCLTSVSGSAASPGSSTAVRPPSAASSPLWENKNSLLCKHTEPVSPSSTSLMAEVAFAGEDHGDAVAVGHADGFVVADRAAGLDDGGDACSGGGLHAIGEGEVGIGGQHRAARPRARFLHRQLHAGDAVHLPRAYTDDRQLVRQHDGVGFDVA